jgi:hypothetical protein
MAAPTKVPSLDKTLTPARPSAREGLLQKETSFGLKPPQWKTLGLPAGGRGMLAFVQISLTLLKNQNK